MFGLRASTIEGQSAFAPSTGSLDVVRVNNMDKIDRSQTKSRRYSTRKRNLKICNISNKYIFTVISFCTDLSWLILPQKFPIDSDTLTSATFKNPIVVLKQPGSKNIKKQSQLTYLQLNVSLSVLAGLSGILSSFALFF